MQALFLLIIIGLSISFGCFEIASKRMSSLFSFSSRLRSLNSCSPFRIKSLGLKPSF